MIQLARLEFRSEDGVVVATIIGEIDMSNATDIRRAIGAELTNHTTALIIDLTGVTYLDSAAIHVIYELREQLGQRGLGLRLVVPPEAPPMTALRLAGVLSVVPTLDTVADAEASLA
jgi:anti-anti-sigma factor